jgi:hypothetical protein
MTHLLVQLLCIAGFACLCAAMARHQADFVGRKLDPRTGRHLRAGGLTVLAIALAAAMAGLGAGYGAVAWCGHMTVAAALVLFRLNRAGARNSTRTARRDVR